MSQQPPPKRDVMIALLQQADSVFVQFDPRREGVLIPAHLKRQPRVVLQYGMNMAIPIPDLEVNEQGIGATLSFSHTPSWTFVPWSAVFAIVSNDQQHGMLWEADVPHDPEAETRSRPEPSPAQGTKSKASRGKGGRPALRAVRGDEAGPPNASVPEAAGAPPSSPPSPQSPPSISPAEPFERPALASVPDPTPALTPVLTPAPTPTVASTDEPQQAEQAAARPSEQQTPPSTSAPAPAPEGSDELVEPPPRDPPRKKRELPPYLRVVK